MVGGLLLGFEPLGRQQDRSAFLWGDPALDIYLKTRAGQDARRNLARVIVAVTPDETTIVGYYTLSTLAIAIGELTAEIARKLPGYDEMPAALIGRLGRDPRYRTHRIGEGLMAAPTVRLLQAGAQPG